MLPKRFWKKVDKNGPVPAHRPDLGPCHLWMGTLTERGYGNYGHGKTRRVHILVFEDVHGPVPEGLELDHLCRVRRCCNDAHVEPVTRSVNVQRGEGPALLGARRRAVTNTKTHCRGGHAFTPANTYVDRKERRRCRACARTNQANLKQFRA